MRQKKTIDERARELGLTVDAYKRHLKQQIMDKNTRKSECELWEKSAGWNPKAGPKKKL